MKKIVVLLSCCLMLGLVQAQDSLTAVKVKEATLDANAEFWSNVPVLEVQTKAAKEGKADGPMVSLQAAYDKDVLVLKASWSDETENVFHNGWTFDGTSFSKSGNEDRILITWPIGNNAEFASKGCTVACHNSSEDENDWWMGSEDDATHYDVWHWKASRTNPAGYADDKWWGPQTDPTVYGKGSRHGDSKDSGSYSSNVNDEGNAPKFISKNGPNQPIFAGEEVEVDLTALTVNDIIPGEILSRPTGSRGDIDAVGVWADGQWVVVMKRALNTGHEDDVVFTPRKRLPFGLAVLDNADGVEHSVGPEVLVLDWK